jgi:two-component system, OmpR family, sensor kinase
VAGALAQIQRLIAEVPDGPTRTRARQVEASLTDLAELAEKLLQLSRAEAGIGRADHPVDLMPVLRLVVTDFRRRAAGSKRLKLLVEDDAALIEAVDIDAFAIALRNLIENALLHGDPNGPVTVSVDPAGRSIAITNRGTVIERGRLASLTQRFARGDTIAAGAGLGLAIANTLVEGMGARLVLLSPAPGDEDGFQARIEFVVESTSP